MVWLLYEGALGLRDRVVSATFRKRSVNGANNERHRRRLARSFNHVLLASDASSLQDEFLFPQRFATSKRGMRCRGDA